MADVNSQEKPARLDEKNDKPDQSDASLTMPPEAAPEPKPDEPEEMAGWTAYWVRETHIPAS